MNLDSSAPRSHQFILSQLQQFRYMVSEQPTEAASLPVNAPGTYWAHSQSRISPSVDLQTSSTLVKQTVRLSVDMRRCSGVCGQEVRGKHAERSCPLLRCWIWHFMLVQDFSARSQRDAPGARRERRRPALLPFPPVCWRRIMTRTGMGLFNGSRGVHVEIKSPRIKSSFWKQSLSFSLQLLP